MMAFDDKLKDDFFYAWSLPPHPTFEEKMLLIKAAINEAAALPPYDYPQCQVFYFTQKIHEVVQVSWLLFKMSLYLK